jgi:DNA-binding protein H-NS
MSEIENEYQAVQTELPLEVSNQERLGYLLNSMTFPDLLSAKQAIESKIADVAASEKEKLVETAQFISGFYGVKPEELFVAPKKRAAKKETATIMKFRHPDDPEKVWSGKGRKPEWFVQLAEQGLEPVSLAA